MAEFTHNTVSYRLVPTDEWTWLDALYAKRASGGMSVMQIERGVGEADPDACIAMIAVSVHRERDTIDAEKLRVEIENSGAGLVAWFEELDRDEITAVSKAVDPPTNGATAPAQSRTTTTPVRSGGLLS